MAKLKIPNRFSIGSTPAATTTSNTSTTSFLEILRSPKMDIGTTSAAIIAPKPSRKRRSTPATNTAAKISTSEIFVSFKMSLQCLSAAVIATERKRRSIMDRQNQRLELFFAQNRHGSRRSAPVITDTIRLLKSLMRPKYWTWDMIKFYERLRVRRDVHPNFRESAAAN